jgi:hypothetical protein
MTSVRFVARSVRFAACVAALLFVSAQSGCCFEMETSYSCGACLKEPKCKYCTAMLGYFSQSRGRKAAKKGLCRSLVGVPGTGVDTTSEATCLAVPDDRFKLKCEKLQRRKWFFEDTGLFASLRAGD